MKNGNGKEYNTGNLIMEKEMERGKNIIIMIIKYMKKNI